MPCLRCSDCVSAKLKEKVRGWRLSALFWTPRRMTVHYTHTLIGWCWELWLKMPGSAALILCVLLTVAPCGPPAVPAHSCGHLAATVPHCAATCQWSQVTTLCLQTVLPIRGKTAFGEGGIPTNTARVMTGREVWPDVPVRQLPCAVFIT